MRGLLVALCCLTLTSLTAQENLVTNGGFEREADAAGAPAGWSVERQNGTTGSFARDPQQPASGQASLRIEHPVDDSLWVRANIDGLPAALRTVYRCDAAVRATGPWQILAYEFTPENQEQPYVTWTIATGTSTANQWQRVGLTFTTGNLAKTFRISLIARGQGVVWFDDLALVKVGAIPDADAIAVEQAPRLDGRLDDTCWQQAPRVGPFFSLGPGGDRPQAATWFRVAWTKTHLLLAYECDEPEMAKLKAEFTEYDSTVYLDDCVETFLDPDSGGSGYAQLVVNSRGARFDQRRLGTTYNVNWYSSRSDATLDWDPQWSAAASTSAKGWTVELMVPFESLGSVPQPGDTWGANFCRERYAVPELSTWSPLPGDTFLVPQNFGRLTFRGPAAQPPAVLTRAPQQLPPPLPVVPQPRVSRLERATVALTEPLRLVPGGAEAARYVAACAPLVARCTVAPTGSAAGAGAVKLTCLADLPEAQRVPRRASSEDTQARTRPEAYQIQSSGRGVEIIAPDSLGIRHGLMTLASLLRRGADGRLSLPAGAIYDWPDCAVRSWHVGSPSATQGDVFRTWVNALARLKYNTLMLEVNDSFAYEQHPEIARTDAPTKAQLREWVEYAKSLGFNVIPQVQVYGHFNWVLNKPGWENLAENPNATGRWGRWNANIRDPRYYPLVFDLFQEVIDVFQPSIFHIGHDEITFQPIAVHPDTKGVPPADLLTEEVTKLHAWLTAKGLKVMMWGDMLLKEHYGGQQGTYFAVDRLPRDIIMADWHYGPNEAFPSVAFLKSKGYPVVACGWWNPLNLYHLSNVAVAEQVLGFSGTSWWNPGSFHQSAELQTAFVLGAENSWSNRQPTIDQLAYEPLQVWRHLAGWGGPAPETRFSPLDLSRYANQSLSDTKRRTGWLGLGPDQDFSSLPRGLRWLDGVPYQLLDAPAEVIMLAAAADPPRAWPASVKSIPVGTKARALYVAATCSAPPRRTSDIYDRGTLYPRNLGRYVLHYADGTEADAPIVYRGNLTDWNAGLPPAQAPTIWSGRTAGGSYAQLSGWRWDNPHPEKVIQSLDIRTAEAPLRVIVVAVTAALE